MGAVIQLYEIVTFNCTVIGAIEEYGSQLGQLINDKNLGVVTSALGLLQEMAIHNPVPINGAVAHAISRLSKLVQGQPNEFEDYGYHFVVAPWLSVKLLRFLQYFPPPEDALIRSRLNEALDSILNKVQEPPQSKKIYHSNAKNAILFEAIYLIIHLEYEHAFMIRACNHIGSFMQHKEANLRYLTIEVMVLLGASEVCHGAVVKHLDTVLTTLKTDKDISIRQRCADLLYSMCDHENAENIISELLTYLEKADYAIREELVLKIAILAEKFAVDFQWYVMSILNLIRVGGDFVSEEVWHRVIQIVINREDIQGYAAKLCFEALQAPACHETMLKVGGYILGEFGNNIAGDARSSPYIQFRLLHSKFFLCSHETRALLLSTYMKFMNLFPELRPTIQAEISKENQTKNANVELQQRAVEYLSLSRIGNDALLGKVLEEMPPFPEKESSLMAILRKKAPAVPAHKEDKMASAGSSGDLQRNVNPSPTQAPPSTLLEAASKRSPVASTPVAPQASLLELGSTVNGNAPLTEFLVAPNLEGSEARSIEDVKKDFLLKNNGVLFENDWIQVGVKSEFSNRIGKLNIFYGNKSNNVLNNFEVAVALSSDTSQSLQIVPQTNPPTSVASGAQEQQVLQVECTGNFRTPPSLDVTFMLAGNRHKFSIFLPVFLSKFLEPTQMTQDNFFSRWKLLAGDKESQRIFPAIKKMERSIVNGVLSSLGLAVLQDIDPNASNYVSAGIVQIKDAPSGVLIRLEPNEQTNMYRLTIRSSKGSVSETLQYLLTDQF